MIKKNKKITFPWKDLFSFVQHETFSGLLLILSAAAAVALFNSPIQENYTRFLEYSLGWAGFRLSVHHWINDGLMTLFFFVIGLEIKRERLTGELQSLAAALRPIAAAIGGCMVPAALYAWINWGLPSLRGWGIPMATDIAFSLGILALAASAAPKSITIFLTTLAIADDILAIAVIALFYSTGLSFLWILTGSAALTAAFLLPRLQAVHIISYTILGLLAWYSFYQGGIHPTVAGVILGLSIPGKTAKHSGLLQKIEHNLHPWSAFLVMPAFALANAGFSVSALQTEDLLSPTALGIIIGLFIGKPLGITGVIFLCKKQGWMSYPPHTSLTHFWGAGSLAGIGFTMSLFIASLAFSDPSHLPQAKAGILFASILSALWGMVIFKLFARAKI